MNENFYMLAISANRQMTGGYTQIQIKTGGAWACSDEEACDQALTLAKSDWPPEDGWYDHGAVCDELPISVISWAKKESPQTEPKNPCCELWAQVLADTLLPWERDVDIVTYHCIFCGHSKPGHNPTCPYAQARVLANERSQPMSSTFSARQHVDIRTKA